MKKNNIFTVLAGMFIVMSCFRISPAQVPVSYAPADAALLEIKLSPYTTDKAQLKTQVKKLEKILKEYPDFPKAAEVNLLLGMKYKSLKMWKKGIVAYQLAYKLNPNNNKNYIDQNINYLSRNYTMSNIKTAAVIYLVLCVLIIIIGRTWKNISLRLIIRFVIMVVVLFCAWGILLLVQYQILLGKDLFNSKMVFVFLWIKPFTEPSHWMFLAYGAAGLLLSVLSTMALSNLIKNRIIFYPAGIMNAILATLAVIVVFYSNIIFEKATYKKGYYLFKGEIENIYPQYPNLFPKDFNPSTGYANQPPGGD